MKQGTRYIWLLPGILIVQISFAQLAISNNSQEKYQASHWEVKDGLIDNAFNSILKDSYGFIWFASIQGLSRFDGKKFINYTRSSDFGLIEDSLHNIWVGSGNGLSRFDIRADSFSVIYSPAPAESSTNFIVPFWASRDDIFCVEKASQITSYNIHSLKKRIVLDEFKLKQGVNGEDFFRFHFSILGRSGKSVWMLDRGGLTEITFSTGQQQYYPLPCRNNITGHSHDAPGMCYDKKRNLIWLNTTEGLVRFDLLNKQFTPLTALTDLLSKKNYGVYPGISIDPKGRIWFASEPPNGILIYDPNDQSVNRAFPDPDLQQKISEDNMCLYCDRDSIVWIGKWARKGIYQVNPLSKTVSRYVSHKNNPYSISNDGINSVANGPSGKLWIGTYDGLNIFDPATSVFRVLRKNDLKGINSNVIKVLAIDTIARKAWIACSPPYRFFEVDLNTMKCRKIILKDSAGQIIKLTDYENISSVHYKQGCIVSVRRRGVFLMNRNSLEAREIIRYTDEVVTEIATGDDQFLFLRLYGSSSCRTYIDEHNTWNLFSTPLDSAKWSCIYFNQDDQTYWVGGLGKLMHYNKNFKPILLLNEKTDLGEKGILGIAKDNDGNIWLNNSSGEISVFNLKTGKLNTLEEKDGYIKQLFEFDNPRINDTYGDIYFAGDDGLDRISPAKLKNQLPPSYVYLHSLEINDKRFSAEKGANDLKELSLKYFQNRISFETGNIDFYSKGKSQIRYKLEGLNNNWQYAPDFYTIRYEALQPNKYKLVIQASNATNEFNGPEKVLFIHISPAFWNTWLFRIVAACCLAALFYGLMRWRLKQKFRRQLERSEKELQVAGLKQKATELEMQALRAQMNPHFIFNSLNSINRFILQNNRAQASEYLTKFSKLVRLILQNSQASLIPLESELESLELYLNLEAVRFNYHFYYKISVPKDMDISALQVPPLILQPYVENAIWHGLMHKEEKGKLDVEVSEEDDHLYFKITDNGVGREKAAELASKSATKHKSMGLRITANRIAIIQKSQTLESPVSINDLVNADGTAAGTEVVIKMPVMYD